MSAAVESSTRFSFPASDVILAHLQQDSSIKGPLKGTDEEIGRAVAPAFEAIAHLFAHRDLSVVALEYEVHLLTYHFQKDLKLRSSENELPFRRALIASLHKCAEVAKDQGIAFPRPLSQEASLADALIQDPSLKEWMCGESAIFQAAVKVCQVVAKVLVAPTFLKRLEEEELQEVVSLATEDYKETLVLSEESESRFTESLTKAVQKYAHAGFPGSSNPSQDKRILSG